jgi:hypothetical protein
MLLPAANPYLPWWLVVPAAALVMLMVAAHVLSIQHSDVPASRRRIRTANGLLMLVVVPLFAYAVTVPHKQSPQAFALVWVAVMALIGMIIMLALLDILNNVRLQAHQRADASREAAEELLRQVQERGGAGPHLADADDHNATPPSDAEQRDAR